MATAVPFTSLVAGCGAASMASAPAPLRPALVLAASAPPHWRRRQPPHAPLLAAAAAQGRGWGGGGRVAIAAAAGVGSGNSVAEASRAPLYVFADNASQKFERIDDVIMGGISTSKLVDQDGFTSWRGLVRTDGGGFCGQRTRPFTQTLDLSGADGLYITCRLASDEDADRRVWKLALRTEEGRGEVVYQAPFVPPTGGEPRPVYVPFSDFVLVRGPVAVPGAPKISNVSAIYQLGFTVSKFVIGATMTPLEGFRNGTFQLDIAELGAFSEASAAASWKAGAAAPAPLSEDEAQRKRPLALRLLFPVLRRVFSEEKRRKKQAAKLLAARGASRLRLLQMSWEFKRNLRGQSFLTTTLQTASGLVSAAFGLAVLLFAKILVFPFVRLAFRRRRRLEERRLQQKAEFSGDKPVDADAAGAVGDGASGSTA